MRVTTIRYGLYLTLLCGRVPELTPLKLAQDAFATNIKTKRVSVLAADNRFA